VDGVQETVEEFDVAEPERQVAQDQSMLAAPSAAAAAAQPRQEPAPAEEETPFTRERTRLESGAGHQPHTGVLDFKQEVGRTGAALSVLDIFLEIFQQPTVLGRVCFSSVFSIFREQLPFCRDAARAKGGICLSIEVLFHFDMAHSCHLPTLTGRAGMLAPVRT
jgi:hypothetical protein